MAVPDGTVGKCGAELQRAAGRHDRDKPGGTLPADDRHAGAGQQRRAGLASDGKVEDYVVSVQAPPAELRLNKVASSVTVVAGDLVTYTLTYSNVGAGPAAAW